MPFFQINQNKVTRISKTNFSLERDLHNLVQDNLETFFDCRFVASEYSTGSTHAGRIDTLALSEENNPVIVEYKKVEASDLINQTLFYLSWIRDHKGDFELAVAKSIGPNTPVDWSDIRVICIAPDYKKYDTHMAQEIRTNIELWKYRLYENGSLYLEEIHKSSSNRKTTSNKVRPEEQAMESASVPSFEFHLQNKPDFIVRWAQELREFILGLDESIEEKPRKMYIAYKASANIAGIQYQRKSISIYLKLKPEEIDEADRPLYRDVSNIGTYAPGSAEFTITEDAHLDIVKKYIRKAYDKLDG
jgi:predicted transport protein